MDRPARPPGLRTRAVLAVTRRMPPFPRALGVALRVGQRLAGKRPVQVALYGLPTALDPRDHGEALLLFGPQLWDRAARRQLDDLSPGEVFLDVGAHLGAYAGLAADRVGPTGRVVAFEPHPDTARRLRERVAPRPQVTVVEAAAAGHDGEAWLGEAGVDNGGGRSLLKGTAPGARVPTVRLSRWLRDHGVGSVAAAKLDVEGLEFQVLTEWLDHTERAAWPRWILFEHHPALISAAGGDAVAALVARGFEVQPVDALNWLAVRR